MYPVTGAHGRDRGPRGRLVPGGSAAPPARYTPRMGGFRDSVLRVVRHVPPGRVVTYGQVALLAGRPGAARAVGAVLRGLRPSDGDVPWQRVVNAAGGLSTYKIGHGELQAALLRAEGVPVRHGKVPLARCRWWPDDELAGVPGAPGGRPR